MNFKYLPTSIFPLCFGWFQFSCSGHQSPKEGLLQAIHHLLDSKDIQPSPGELPTGVRTRCSGIWRTGYLKMKGLEENSRRWKVTLTSRHTLLPQTGHKTQEGFLQPFLEAGQKTIMGNEPSPHTEVASFSPHTQGTREYQQTARTQYSLHLPQDPCPTIFLHDCPLSI